MVHRHYGGHIPITEMRELCDLTIDGVSMQGLMTAAETLGFDVMAAPADARSLDSLPVPFIAHWLKEHFVVVYEVTPNRIRVADPEMGRVSYTRQAFLDRLLGTKMFGAVQRPDPGAGARGTVLLLSPGAGFLPQDGPPPRVPPMIRLRGLLGEVRRDLLWIALAFPAVMAVTIALPLIMQRVIDDGVSGRDVGALTLLLGGYLVLLVSRNVIGALRDLLLLKVGAHVSIEIVHRFMTRLLQLRIGFFERRSLGDLVQRQQDTHRIEQFLTTQSLPTFFSILTFVFFAVMLAYYSLTVLAVVALAAILTLVWISVFTRRRRAYDLQQFELEGLVQENAIEIMSAVTDLKSFGMERQKGRFYRSLLRRRYDTTLRALRLDEMQSTGALLLMDLGEIAALLLAGRQVIAGGGSLGTFVAVMYILGQLRGPLARMVPFSQTAQDAWLSFGRLQSLQQEATEPDSAPGDAVLDGMPPSDLHFDAVDFRYNPIHRADVLHGLSFAIRAGEKTAIVGASGSGKTTLLKLMGLFHRPTAGRIRYGGLDLADVSPAAWRRRIGQVFQEGTIFNTTLSYNITLSHDTPDAARLAQVTALANVDEFLPILPLGLATSVGRAGWQLSTGQKQRVLIARALYRDPEILILDEATSALDSNNEAEITRNLADIGAGRTSIVISHRLSTIRDADQIIVLERGRVAEIGRHDDLIARDGTYRALFRHQLGS
jgi:ATP-binding cassette subfamily B protein